MVAAIAAESAVPSFPGSISLAGSGSDHPTMVQARNYNADRPGGQHRGFRQQSTIAAGWVQLGE